MLKAWCRAKERQINAKKSTGCPNDLYNWERQYALTKSASGCQETRCSKGISSETGKKNRETLREDVCASCVYLNILEKKRKNRTVLRSNFSKIKI